MDTEPLEELSDQERADFLAEAGLDDDRADR